MKITQNNNQFILNKYNETKKTLTELKPKKVNYINNVHEDGMVVDCFVGSEVDMLI